MGLVYLDMVEEELKIKLQRATLVTRQGLNEALELVQEINKREFDLVSERFEKHKEEIKNMSLDNVRDL